MERQLIKSYHNFDLMGVYRNGTLLWKESVSKPLPTDSENYRKIQGFEKAIVVTEEEKNDGKIPRNYPKNPSGSIRLYAERRREVELVLMDQNRTKKSIARDFKMSLKTIDKIIREMDTTQLVKKDNSKFVVDTLFYHLNGVNKLTRLITEPHEIITRELIK